MDCLKGRNSLQPWKQWPWAILQTHPENREYFVILTRMQPPEVLLVDINLLQFIAHNDIWGIWQYSVSENPLYQIGRQTKLESLEQEKCILFAVELKRGEQIVTFKAYNKTYSWGENNWHSHQYFPWTIWKTEKNVSFLWSYIPLFFKAPC